MSVEGEGELQADRWRNQNITTAITAPSAIAARTIAPVRPSDPMRTSRSCVSPVSSFGGEMILTMTGFAF